MTEGEIIAAVLGLGTGWTLSNVQRLIEHRRMRPILEELRKDIKKLEDRTRVK